MDDDAPRCRNSFAGVARRSARRAYWYGAATAGAAAAYGYPYGPPAPYYGLRRKTGGVGVRTLEFCILTAARTGEVRGATWDELGDMVERTCAISAERMKADREHRVPLSDRVIEIVGELRAIRQGALLFPGAKAGRPLSHGAMLRVLEAMGRDDLSVHGFRSTFRDWAAECTSFARDICEAALAHAVENKAEAAYRRGDLFEKRRQLMRRGRVTAPRRQSPPTSWRWPVRHNRCLARLG
jgi:integrase